VQRRIGGQSGLTIGKNYKNEMTATARTRLVIADDHPLFRNALRPDRSTI